MAVAAILMISLVGATSTGCVGDDTGTDFGCGATVTKSCTFNESLSCPAGYGLIIGANGITIDGTGYTLDGDSPGACGDLGVQRSGIETPSVTPSPTPTSDVSVSPALKGYGFSIYGELLDYVEEGKLVTLKINQKIKDCEKNTSFVEITANSTKLIEHSKSSAAVYSEDKIIRSIDELEVGKKYHFRFYSVYGEFLGVNKTENTVVIKYMVDYTDGKRISIDHIPISRFEEAFEEAKDKMLTISDLIRGENYCFYFFKENEDDIWELHRIKEELDKESCFHLHENDLSFHFLRKEAKPPLNDSERCVELIPLIIKEGEIGHVMVNMTNKQDQELQYNLSASVHEYYTLSPSPQVKTPSFEDRLNESQVDYCRLIYDKSGSVKANSSKVVDIGVMCKSPNETTNITGNYVIYLTLTFVDELGAVHNITGDYLIETFCVNNCVISEHKYGAQPANAEKPVTPSPAPIQHETKTTAPAPSSPMKVELSVSNAPALNEIVELTCSITSVSDAPNTTAQIVLAESFELVGGNLSWNGDMIVPEEEKRKHPRPNRSDPEYDRLCEEYEYPKGKAEFGVLIKSVEVGNWTITATAGYDVFTQEGTLYGRLGDSDYVYLAVREDTAWISETLFTTEGPAPARQLNVTPPLPPVEPTTENITTPEPVKPPSVPPTGMEVNLSISNAPALNEIAELTCSIMSVSDAYNTEAQIVLSEGLSRSLCAITFYEKGGE